MNDTINQVDPLGLREFESQWPKADPTADKICKVPILKVHGP